MLILNGNRDCFEGLATELETMETDFRILLIPNVNNFSKLETAPKSPCGNRLSSLEESRSRAMFPKKERE